MIKQTNLELEKRRKDGRMLEEDGRRWKFRYVVEEKKIGKKRKEGEEDGM